MGTPYDNLDFGPIMLKYTYEPGQKLPEVGEVIKNDACSMVVTESNEKEGYVKVLLNAVDSLADRMSKYREEVDETVCDIAEMLYKETSDGMTARIGWDNLSKDTRSIYLRLALKSISMLDDRNLLILKYKEDI